MTKLYPTHVQPRRRNALKPEDLDKLGQAVLTLAKELWVVKDRQTVTEAVLAKRGIDIGEEISLFQPDEKLEARLAAERQELVKKLMQDLTGEYEPLS
ncbi:MAG: hypothetical protein JNM81_05855 [Rhodospirillaceae bacterium]|nr:hypothetical protein [Rhodospirillaceae bacterium]